MKERRQGDWLFVREEPGDAVAHLDEELPVDEAVVREEEQDKNERQRVLEAMLNNEVQVGSSFGSDSQLQ